MTRRRWIADRWTESTAVLAGDQALHLARVLRAEPGTEYDIVAGGTVWRAAVATVDAHEVLFNLIAEIESEPALPVTLLLSIFKFDRMEWAIEKATELGVDRIAPVIARRTEKHLALAAEKRVERWRRLVKEASQQSRRSDVPEVSEAAVLKIALQQSLPSSSLEGEGIPEGGTTREGDANRVGGAVLNIVLSEQEQSITLKRIIEEAGVAGGTSPRIQLAIGPEGGWAPDEIEIFHSASWKTATLGPRILRAETAAISALAVVAALID